MWVVVALCILIALMALVLCIPLYFGIRVEVLGKPVVDFTVEWFFGRIRRESRAARHREKKPVAPAGARAKKAGKQPRFDRETAGFFFGIVRTPGLRRSVPRLLKRILHCFRLRDLCADFRVCLDDPADTVLLVGPAAHAALVASIWSGWPLRITPVLEDRLLLEGEGWIVGRVVPIRLVPPVIVFFLSPSTVRVAARLLRWRLRRK